MRLRSLLSSHVVKIGKLVLFNGMAFHIIVIVLVVSVGELENEFDNDDNDVVIFDATLLGQLFYAKLLKPSTEGMKKEKYQRNIHQQLEDNPYDVYDDSEGMVIGMIG